MVQFNIKKYTACENMEITVLTRLKWDVSSVTPIDFLGLLIARLPISHLGFPEISPILVRWHAQSFITLAAKEHHFSIYSASTISASSIAAALVYLKWDLKTGRPLIKLLDRLTDLTGVEQDYLSTCMNEMEKLYKNHQQNLTMPYTNEKQCIEPQKSEKGIITSGTPTDVQDVKF